MIRFSFIALLVLLCLSLPLSTNCSENVNASEPKAETHEFQAEVSRLMDIIINSLYTQKEVFLRELISNAADALEKVRFLAVSDASILKKHPLLEIRILTDKEAKTLTIEDSGVGMTKRDLISNLGTVARSGTTNFLEALAHGADVNLIGQFGVGFYSAFLVADRVSVASKSDAEDIQHLWESSADAKFTVTPDPEGSSLKRGTRITLHLKDDCTEFLDAAKLRAVVTKFNQFVNFPIMVQTERVIEEEVPRDEEEVEESEDGEEKPKTTTIKKTIHEWEQLNKLKPIWLRSKDDVNETEYSNFYKSLTNDPMDPLSLIHFSAEGEVDFKSILFVPSHEPFDAWSSYFSAKQDGIKVYARRVLVAEEVYELLPKWLNFIKGVVDSDDLPLKVDRESLSQTKMMRVISKKLVGKFMEMVRKMSKEDRSEWEEYRKQSEAKEAEVKAPDTKYGKFWNFFGKNMKVGCVEDDANRDKLVKLFRFHTTKTGEKDSISLDEYTERMSEGQKDILYISNDNFDGAMNSPHIQIFKKKGWEVLVLTDPLDESCVQRVMTYNSKPLKSVEKTNSKIDMTDDEKSKFKKITMVFKPLTSFLSSHLKDKIARVQLSQRLVDDAAAISAEAFGHSAFAERVMKAQTFSAASSAALNRNRVFELNPSHPLIKKLLEMVKNSPDDPQAELLADSLFDAALLNSGFSMDDPQRVVRQLVELMRKKAGVDDDAVVEDYVLSPEEEEEGMEASEDTEEPQGDMPDFDEETFQQMLKNMPSDFPTDHDEL